jgi:uncharacterized protein (TIGR03000 family)
MIRKALWIGALPALALTVLLLAAQPGMARWWGGYYGGYYPGGYYRGYPGSYGIGWYPGYSHYRYPGFYGSYWPRAYYNYGWYGYPGYYGAYPAFNRGFTANVYTDSAPSLGYRSSYYSPDASVAGSEERDRAHLDVRVPANAQVWVEGQQTRQTGPEREFVSPPLDPNRSYTYDLRARWEENGRMVDRTRQVPVRAGERRTVDFLGPDLRTEGPAGAGGVERPPTTESAPGDNTGTAQPPRQNVPRSRTPQP